MSGITPLLDTLLHQVLGRRVDIPVARDMNLPVGPPVSVEGARPVHSDSRLDARSQSQAPVAGQSRIVEPAHEAAVRGDMQSTRQAVVTGAASAPSSTVITLSAAAREIADLLQRYPASQSAIRPALPLLPASVPPIAQSVERIAAQLQQSIEHSGLFYESHVARWSRGELPLEVLRREPQMQAFTSAGSAVAPSVSPSVPLAASQQAVLAGVQEAAVKQSVTPDEADLTILDATALEPEPAAGRQEALTALVRQQLELLAVPQLRWEGQIWAGLFMALNIEAPPEQDDSFAGEGERGDEGGGGQSEWRIRVDLHLSGGGDLAADIRLCGDALGLTLHSEAVGLREYFARTRDVLQESLAACGFQRVELSLDAEEVGHE